MCKMYVATCPPSRLRHPAAAVTQWDSLKHSRPTYHSALK